MENNDWMNYVSSVYVHPVALAIHLGLMAEEELEGMSNEEAYGEALARLLEAGYPVLTGSTSKYMDLFRGVITYGSFAKADPIAKDIIKRLFLGKT